MSDDTKKARLEDLQTQSKIVQNPAAGEPMDEMPEMGEDMNSTMMAIDLNKLQSMDATRTGILKTEAAAEVSVTGVSQSSEITKSGKPSFLRRFYRNFFLPPSHTDSHEEFRPQKRWPLWMQKWVGVWLPEREWALAEQIQFVLVRLGILLGVLLSIKAFLPELSKAVSKGHPAQFFLLTVFVLQILFSLAVVFLRKSPLWLFAFLVSAFSLVFGCAAIFYHTADSAFFTVSGIKVSDFLSRFYLDATLMSAVLMTFLVKNLRQRVLSAIVFGGPAVFFAVVWRSAIPLEWTLTGWAITQKYPLYIQPLSIVLAFYLPFLTLMGLVVCFLNRSDKIARSGALAIVMAMMALSGLGYALLQKNRVPHVLNVVWPLRLDVGGMVYTQQNQVIRIETKNLKANEGLDILPRYRFQMGVSRQADVSKIKIHDAFGFPVNNLSQNDMQVFSDNLPIKDFKFYPDESVSERGLYLLTLKLQNKESLIQWDKRAAFSPSDVLTFRVRANSAVKKVVLRRDDDLLGEFEDFSKGKIELPAYYFGQGSHEIVVQAFDELKQKIHEEVVKFAIKPVSDFSVLLPRSGDFVGHQLKIVSWVRGAADAVSAVKVLVDDVLVFEGDALLSSQSFDVSHLADGAHRLSVQANVGGREINRTIEFNKAPHVPKLVFVTPGMGVYAERTTNFEIKSDTGSTIKSVNLQVNGNDFTDVQFADGQFVLPSYRFEDKELFVSVQAELESGQRVSEWVQINPGQAQLVLSFDLKTLNFLKVKAISLVMDASVSSLDNWQRETKWQTITNLLMAPEVEARLKNFAPSYVVFGSGQTYYYGDCEDAEVVVESDDYNKSTIKRRLSAIHPKGVAALHEALRLSYLDKPERIFVFTDSADSCSPKAFQNLKSILKTSPKTQVIVLAIGQVRASDKEQLIELAEKTGGRFYQPEDYNALLQAMLEQLSLNYEFLSGDKVIHSSPLADKSFKLSPGPYKLKIPYGNQVKEIDLNLEHGTKMELKISGQESGNDRVIKVAETVSEL